MNLFVSMKKIIKRINEIDTKTKKLNKEKCYSTNPFAFQQNKTFVWVERVKYTDNCGRINPSP